MSKKSDLTNTQTYPTIPMLVGIKEAAKLLGVSAKTLRRWESQRKITSERTLGNHRRYDLEKLKVEIKSNLR